MSVSGPFEYQSILPLLTSVERGDGAVVCRYTCPVSRRSVAARVVVGPAGAPAADRGAGAGLRYAAAAALSAILGATREPAAQTGALSAADEPERRAVEASVRSVSSVFRWDRERGRWIARDASSPALTRFEEHLNVHPLEGRDLETLLRMLVEINRADARLSAEKRAFLRPFLRPRMPDVSELETWPSPSPEELRSLDRGRRESLLMICWAAALSDQDAADEELKALDDFAATLEIPAARVEALKNHARRYVLEKALEQVFSDLSMNLAEEERVVSTGRRLGLGLAETLEVIAEFRERRGLSA